MGPAGTHPAAEAGCGSGSANTAGVTGRPEMVLRQQHRHRRRRLSDPELEPDPKLTLTAEQDDELNDEIPQKW